MLLFLLGICVIFVVTPAVGFAAFAAFNLLLSTGTAAVMTVRFGSFSPVSRPRPLLIDNRGYVMFHIHIGNLIARGTDDSIASDVQSNVVLEQFGVSVLKFVD
jgi:hypothetical protein